MEFGIAAPGPMIIDPTGTDQKAVWKKWLKILLCFFTASNITNTKRKKALLLYCGGEDLRRIHDTLDDKVGEDETFENTVECLNRYFDTTTNITYERHLFRNLVQNGDESIKSFVTRLREQSYKCEFNAYSEDQALVDQVVEKCKSYKLRRKLLQERDLNIEKLTSIATSLEMTDRQVAAFENKEQTEEINALRNFNKKYGDTNKKYGDRKYQDESRAYGGAAQSSDFNVSKVKCFACGHEGHVATSSECPAKGKFCNYCRKPNHFEEVCYIKNRERNDRRSWRRKENNNQEKIKNLSIAEDSDDEYLFNIGGHHTDVMLEVEGKKIGFLLDSGALGVNIMDKDSFDELRSKVFVRLYPTKTHIYAYGSNTPLKLEGVFYGNIKANGTKHICRFHVMSDAKSGCVIGRNTATELGLLNIAEGLHAMKLGNKDNKWKNKYPSLFEGLGKMKNFQLKLNIDKEVEPVSQHLRRIPFHVRKKIEQKIEELIKLDILERVEENVPTNWVSPVIAVPKGEDIRMVVDMRQANKAIKRTHYPVPTLDEILEEFNGCKIFSKVDLNQGYHQLELNPESRNITTFITHTGLFRYKRLVQGASSALEEYQHVISSLFKNEKRISNICDDILIGGRDEKEHEENVNKCLDILNKNNLTVNEKKCEWGAKEVTYFGHTLSGDGIRATRSKVETVKAFIEPKCRKQVSSFLGLINFLAKFVPNLSSEAAPLRNLLRKDVEWIWGELEQKTFDNLKNLVNSDTVLAHFSAENKTYLITDAGAVGLGAILAQKQPDESIRPVYYASRTLTNQEKKYSQTEKEALGVVWACERFHLWLFGKPFTILTDHQPLKVLYSPAGKPSPRILR